MNIQMRFRAAAAAVLLAVTVAGCSGGPTKESTGEVLDDSVLTAKVKTALLKDPEVKGTSVNVETFKGVVQLSGFVRTQSERARAGEVARGVGGVSQVRNDLQVRGQ